MQDIRNFISNELKYKYKRGCCRPLRSKSENLKHLWAIFSSRILGAVYENELIVNIDELSYNRSLKSNYSWLPTGDSYPILNTNCTGRTTVIFGLMSNGHWLCMWLNGTTRSRHFWIFILLLHEFIESQSGKQDKHPKLIFDNAKIHLTADVRRLCSYLRFEINTLPPYSPQLAPVETIFGISKKRFQARYKEIGMNFGKPSGKRAVLNTL